MRGRLLTICVVLGLLLGVVTLPASAALTASRTYTLDADFDEGVYSNVVHSTVDQLQLDDTTTPFRFIWVAVSSKGTIVKIDTDTGAVLGEYRTAPEGQPTNPSRTTVDLNGNVWNTNRDGNSVVHVGLKENGQCVDRDGDGIETSTGLGDILPWSNAGGADTAGGVSTAEDECILHYVRVSSSGTRHLSVTPENNVWVSGLGNRVFDLVNGATGAIMRTEGSVGYGGYGGLIDGNGVIWSARPLLRWDTSLPLSGPNGVNWIGYGHDSYGLCIDSQGNVWNTTYGAGSVIRKFAPNGTLLGTFGQGNLYAQGCVVDGNDDVWVAHSLNGNSVGHLKNNGTYVGSVTVGSGPTGVAVDALGKVWATNYGSGTVSRIDPALGGAGGGGSTIGAVDFTTVNLGGNLYNYSDMTGSTLTAPPNSGTWTVVFDSGEPGTEWGRIDWNALVPNGAALSVTAASSEDGLIFSDPPVNVVTKDADFAVPNGRYLKVSVIFNRAPTGESPILYDLTIRIANQPPVVDAGDPYSGNEGAAIPLSGASASDPDLDPLAYAWTYAAGAGVDAGATCAFSDAAILNPAITCTDDGTFVATLTVDDGVNDPVSDSADVVVANVNPVVDITTPTEGALYALGTATNLTAAFTDAGANDTHTCSINWDDLTTEPGAVAEAAGAGTCTGSRTFAAAGVYTILVTVTDDDTEVGTDSVMVIVYDPSAGFVTGGGKILSPAGAYVADPTLTGPASFGFVSKYQKGAKVPTGQTEFQFHVADFNFHSESYQWLVVSGAKAQYKGTGTLNGVPGYGFLLTAVDGQINGGGGVDKFRIKIWDASGVVVYDNVLGAPEDIDGANPTAITSGNIVVHKAK